MVLYDGFLDINLLVSMKLELDEKVIGEEI
jgi:hypothetical protein